MHRDKINPSEEKSGTSLLLLILAIALSLRLTGIGFGLPLRLHPDEWSQVLPALSIFDGNLHPRFFYYPSFTVYFYFIIFKSASIILPGVFHFTASNASFWLLARIVSALFSTASVFAAYKLCEKIYDEKTGLVAAFLMAIFPLSVRHSHFAIVDIPMTFFVLVSLYFMCAGKEGKTNFKSLIMAGVFCGFAASAKYSALPLVAVLIMVSFANCADEIKRDEKTTKRIPFILASLLILGIIFLALSLNPLRTQINGFLAQTFSADGIIEKGDLGYIFLNRLNGIFWFLGFFLPSICVAAYFIPYLRKFLAINFFDKRIIVPPLISLLVFFAVSPYMIIDFAKFVYDVKFAVKVTTLGFYEGKIWTAERDVSALFNFLLIFKNNAGVFLSILFPAGLLFSLKKKFLPLILWIAIYLFELSSMKLTMTRFLLPVSAVTIIFASGAITQIARFIREKTSWMRAETIFILAMLLACSQTPLSETAAVEKYFLKPSVLKIAFRWIEGNIPDGKRIMLSGTAPDMRLSEKDYLVAKMKKPDNIYDIKEEFTIEDADFLITGLPMNEISRLLDERTEAGKAELLKSFSRKGGELTGPVIFIYKLRK